MSKICIDINYQDEDKLHDISLYFDSLFCDDSFKLIANILSIKKITLYKPKKDEEDE